METVFAMRGYLFASPAIKGELDGVPCEVNRAGLPVKPDQRFTTSDPRFADAAYILKDHPLLPT